MPDWPWVPPKNHGFLPSCCETTWTGWEKLDGSLSPHSEGPLKNENYEGLEEGEVRERLQRLLETGNFKLEADHSHPLLHFCLIVACWVTSKISFSPELTVNVNPPCL